MVQSEVVISDPTGLHARPAAVFVQAAKGFTSRITVRYDGKEADAKSIMSIMAMGIKNECTISLTAEGADETEAIRKLKSLIESNFTEG
jgi:phosphocarrier protein